MDEPFSALDRLNRDQQRFGLLAFWQSNRKAVLFVTHSVPEAVMLSDRIVVMSTHPGRIHRIIEDKLPRPRNADVYEHPDFHRIESAIVLPSRGDRGNSCLSCARTLSRPTSPASPTRSPRPRGTARDTSPPAPPPTSGRVAASPHRLRCARRRLGAVCPVPSFVIPTVEDIWRSLRDNPHLVLGQLPDDIARGGDRRQLRHRSGLPARRADGRAADLRGRPHAPDDRAHGHADRRDRPCARDRLRLRRHAEVPRHRARGVLPDARQLAGRLT